MKSILGIFIFTVITGGCVQEFVDPNDPKSSFSVAKKAFDSGNYKIAIKKLREFKTRFPYSRYSVDAGLILADSYYGLGNFIEATASYDEFTKLHPKDRRVDYALFRIGESYWSQAPEEIDREQYDTKKAIAEWQKLINGFPRSKYTKRARQLVKIGRYRIARAHDFVASFYCKQRIWHACAYRFVKLSKEFPQFPKLKKKSLHQAAFAFEKLVETRGKEQEEQDNIYYRDLSDQEILEKARALRTESSSMNTP
jgi:outer membrane protein assembly factor BamD